MTQFELVNYLNELRGGLSAAYCIAPSEGDLEAILDKLNREVSEIIEAVKNDICCTTHFVTGGSCSERDNDSEHF